MAGLAGDHEHEADSDSPSDQGADPARGARSVPRDEKRQMHLSADRLERKVLGAALMSRMRTLVEPALAISSVDAGDTTLALAGHPKPSRPMPLPGGVVCGSAVEAK